MKKYKFRSVVSLFLLVVSFFYLTHASASSEPLLVGQGQMKKFGFHLYDISLLTETGQYQGDGPLTLAIDYQVSISRNKLVDVSAVEVERTGGQWLPEWSQRLNEIWPDVRKGDQLTMVIEESGGSLFVYNGSPLGRVADPKFGKAFAAIWLSPKTREPKLRTRLIGVNQ